MARRQTDTPRSRGNGARQSEVQTLSDDQIALRAYFKWQGRGCPIGDELRDWFDAIDELREECENGSFAERKH